MADVDDARGMASLVEAQYKRLENADIAESDREAIETYADWKSRRVSSQGTIKTYVNNLTLSAERSPKPLIEYETITDVDALLDAHEDAGVTKANSLNTYLSAAKGFWKWLESAPEYGEGDYKFRHFIEMVEPNAENPGTDPLPEGYDSLAEFILSEEEIAALREGANNYRDKALISFLCDAGPRITLACQIKRGNVDVSGESRDTFRPNPQGEGHKKVPDKDYLLHESSRHIRVYLQEAHPDDHDDAPLFAKMADYERQDGALHPDSAKKRLKKAAENAGIDPARARPHNLRKTAVTRMRVKHNMTWEAIQMRTGWADSSLSQLKSVYRSIENSDELEMVEAELGAETDTESEELPSPECWQCSRDLEPGDTYCSGCGVSQDVEPGDSPNDIEALLPYIEMLDDEDLGHVIRQHVESQAAE